MEAIQFQLVLEDKISGPAGRANSALSKTEQSLKQTDKTAKKASKSVDEVVASIEMLNAVSAGAVAVFAAIAAAAVGLAFAFAKTITAADAARSELIHTEALYRLARNYEGAEEAAKAYDSVVGATVRSTGQSRESVNKLAEQLVKAGIGGRLFNDTLKRAAQASAVLGDEQANAYIQSVAGAKAFGTSVDAVNARMEKTLGGTAAKAALSLDATMNRLRESFRQFATSIQIDPLLSAFDRLAGNIDRSTWAGRGFQTLMGSVFSALTGGATGASSILDKLFKDFVIFGLKTYIALYPTIEVFKDMVKTVSSTIDTAGLAKGAVIGMVVAFGVLATALASVVGLLSALSHAISLGAKVIGAFYDIGKNIASGVAKGFTEAWDSAVNTIVGLFTKLKDKIKSFLGIASPSKVFAELGKFSGQGFAVGMERAAPAVAAATTRAIAPPSPATTAAQATAAATAAAPARSAQTFAGSVTVNISGVDGAQDLENRMPEIMASAFEAIGLTLGVGPASVGA